MLWLMGQKRDKKAAGDWKNQSPTAIHHPSAGGMRTRASGHAGA